MKSRKAVYAMTGESDAEQAFLARAQAVFRAYPELLSFSLEEEPEANPIEDQEQFDLYVGLAIEVSDDFQQEMCEAVTEFITETVHDCPETLDLLRGRTFARALH